MVTKHHLGKKLTWKQAATFAFFNHIDKGKATIVHVKQIDADTV